MDGAGQAQWLRVCRLSTDARDARDARDATEATELEEDCREAPTGPPTRAPARAPTGAATDAAGPPRTPRPTPWPPRPPPQLRRSSTSSRMRRRLSLFREARLITTENTIIINILPG